MLRQTAANHCVARAGITLHGSRTSSAGLGSSSRADPPLQLTRAGCLAPLIEFLDSIGAPIPRLMRQARMHGGLLDDPQALVPLRLVHRFVEVVAATEGIADLGAVVAARSCAFDVPVLGESLRHALNVYDYLQTGSRLIGNVTSGERFWLTLERDHVRFHHFVPGGTGAGRCHEDIYALLVTIGMLRNFVGHEWSPDEVSLVTTDRRMLGDESVLGGARIMLGESHSSFTLPCTMLQRPVPSALRWSPSDNPGARAVDPMMPSGFLGSVFALVRSLLFANCLDESVVADAAGVSRRTLQRRLRDCGTRFSDVVQRSRTQLAGEWLVHSGLPVRDIASTLGYSDAANFTRAFRRIMGVSPSTYRSLFH